MASVSTDATGARRVLFVAPDGSRKAIRLGPCDKKSADSIRRHVEAILTSKILGQPLPRDTSIWLAELPDKLKDRIASTGLIAPTAKSALGAFLRDTVMSRTDVKPATLTVWAQTVANLVDHFGENRQLRTITPGDCDKFKQSLQSGHLAPATIAKRLAFARTFFHSATRHKLIEENPFEGVSSPAGDVSARQHFIDRATLARVMEHSPPEWRIILALARFGGLRCPSEVLSLEWRQVDFGNSRLQVPSPKTERYPGKETRELPMFSELRPYLEEALELSPPGSRYVVPGNHLTKAQGARGWMNCNIRKPLNKILKRAGIKPWPRLFHNLRASRETELMDIFPIQVVADWLGHDVKVALKHYAQVTADHFAKAIAPLPSPEQVTQKPTQQIAKPNPLGR